MSDSREMTLKEWCAKLPEGHLVNTELIKLESGHRELFSIHEMIMCIGCVKELPEGETESYTVAAVRQMAIRINKLEAQLAELKKGEPVACAYINHDGECEQIEYGTDALSVEGFIPLYLSPVIPEEDQ